MRINARKLFSFALRAGITALAFWIIFRKVEIGTLQQTIAGADSGWLILAVALFLLTQFGSIVRWKLLVPAHPRLTWRFLADSFFVGCFFNGFLPTTVGGDVVRGYDLIKATGEWKESLASILMDRLTGLVGLLILATLSWGIFPPAREDPVLRSGLLGVSLFVVILIGIISSRRVLQASLKPFGKIGLGQLESHAAQFQEALRNYLHRPKALLGALGISLVIQSMAIVICAVVAQALHLSIPILSFLIIVPVVAIVSQIPFSLNGWGIREGTTIVLLQRVGIDPAHALSLSLVGAVIQLSPGVIGGGLFLARQRRRRPPA